MTTISDLPDDLLDTKILPQLPILSLRSTCKKWNAFLKNNILAKELKQEFLGFTVRGSRVCSLRFNLKGIRMNDYVDLVGPSIKQVSILDKVDICNIFYCDGLLLCVIEENSSLLVWNPYLGQTRRIQPRDSFYRTDRYSLGYDNNRSHKILRILDDFGCKSGLSYEIYGFNSNSWKVLDVTSEWDFLDCQHSVVSLNGNTYFMKDETFLYCFDYTRESFRPRLLPPCHSNEEENVTVSCVREEQLAVLYQRRQGIIEIWITTKIEPNAISWSNFLKVDMRLFNGFLDHILSWFTSRSFFIEEENKVAVVFPFERYKPTVTCYIIGEDGYLKCVNIKEVRNVWKPDYGRHWLPLVGFAYVPSLV